AHVVGGLTINRNDDVSRMDPRAISRRPGKRGNHDDLVVTRTHGHAYSVILTALIFTKQGIRLGVEEIRVRVEHMQHARNGAVVNGLIWVHRLGVILFNDVINFGELLEAGTDV